MGIFDGLRVGKRLSEFRASSLSLNISSPYSQGAALEQLLFPDLFGDDVLERLPMDRSQAITIPAVSKARNLLVSTISKFPLVARTQVKGVTGDRIDNQPRFLYRTDTDVSPYERMAWTIDDLIFYGYSLWKRVNSATDQTPLSAGYVPMRDWKITDGHIQINDKNVDESDVIFFNSPFEGLLNVANRTLRGAIDQEASWVGRARNPLPLIELHVTDEGQLNDKEIADFVAAWSKARRSPDGAIGYTPAGLEIKVPNVNPIDMSVEGRNAIRTDVGSFLNIRASMLDGTMGVDSLTYTTTDGEKNSFYELDLPFWTDTIETRLSMDDVCPRGTVVKFDKYSETAPTGPITEEPQS